MKKFLLLLLVIPIAVFFWYRSALNPVDSESTARETIRIEQGASVGSIAKDLEDKGLISSSRAFSWYTRFAGVQGSLQAGTFVLQPSMSVAEIVDALSGKAVGEVSVTIPEGFTVKDIDALLAEKELLTAGAFQECARTCDLNAYTFLPSVAGLAPRGGNVEGYLYPDTYFFGATEDPKVFMDRLLNVFQSRIANNSEYAAEIAASGRSLHELVTMASLIEEETITDAERPIVAGILWKRYDAGQGLGVDATVRYILDKPSAAITRADLDIDSPYNTRKYRGLPPGAIANAGLKSFVAALRPEESRYWYYLHDNQGTIHYAETNDEHNANRARYLP